MELFTEVEFNESELHKIDEVRAKLDEEGWVEIHKNERMVIRPGVGRVLKSVKFKWTRII